MSTAADSTGKPQRHWARSLIDIAVAVLIVLAGKSAIAEPFYVPSGSMEPTLLIGDALLASKYPYGYGTASLPEQIALPITRHIFAALPQRGDVVVFRAPDNPSQIWVKRVVGLPGDQVQMRQGLLFINGAAVPLAPDGRGEVENSDGSTATAARYIETLPGGRSHDIFKLGDNQPYDNTPIISVPPHHLFVLGDNRDDSADSRVPVAAGGVGLLPVDNLVGRVDAVLGSWDLAAGRKPVWAWWSGLRPSRFFTIVH